MGSWLGGRALYQLGLPTTLGPSTSARGETMFWNVGKDISALGVLPGAGASHPFGPEQAPPIGVGVARPSPGSSWGLGGALAAPSSPLPVV